MFWHDGPSWAALLAFSFGMIAYVAFLLGVLWLATRVVRHAWFWRSSSASPSPPDTNRDSSGTGVAG